MQESLILFTAIAVLAVPAVAIAAIVLAIKLGNRYEELARRLDNLSREVRHLRARHIEEFGADSSREEADPEDVTLIGSGRDEARGVEGSGVAVARDANSPPRTSSEMPADQQSEKRGYSFSFLDREEFSLESSMKPSPAVELLKQLDLHPPDPRECGQAELRNWWMKRTGILTGVLVLAFIAVLLSRNISPWLGGIVVLGIVLAGAGYTYSCFQERSGPSGKTAVPPSNGAGRLSTKKGAASERAEQSELFPASNEQPPTLQKPSGQIGKAKKRTRKQGRRKKHGK